MTDLTIDHLSPGAAPSGVEPFPTVQSGFDAYLTVSQISTYAGTALKGATNTWTGVNTFGNQLAVALGATALFTPVTVTGAISNYFEINSQNTSSNAAASTDHICTADTGTATTKYIDFGINSSTYSGGVFGTALEGYLYTSDDNLNIGAAGASKVVRVLAGGSSVGSNTVATFASTGLTVTALTLGSLAGLLKGTAGVVSAATAGTDYLTPTGVGTGLTALNGSNITSGTVGATYLPTFGTAAAGIVPASGGGTTNFLRADGTWAVAGAGTISSLTGDVTASGSGAVAATIAANAVTYAKFQQVAASSLVGNATGSLANATGITLGAALAFSGSVLQTAALTGDVTATANSFATTIAVGAVTDAKASLAMKPPCKVAAVANVASLSGTTTIDSVAVVAGDVVFLTAQSTASQNGPWVIAAGAWTRPTWYPNGGTTQAFYGAEFAVLLGTVYANSTWYISTTGAITIGTTSVALTQGAFGTWLPTGGGASLAGTNTWTAANTFSYTSIASTPAVKLSGTWFTGGTSTTTFPHFLVQASSATPSTQWSTSGTGIGVNASGLCNLVDLQTNGVSKFIVDSTGYFSNAAGAGIAGRVSMTGNGTASASGLSLTGQWFTGGSASTNWPQLYVKGNAATDSSWSTAGTAIGANANSGFTGNLLDLQVNGVSTLSVSAAGLLLTSASTTTSAGLRLPHGAAPTSPANGDVWTTTAGSYEQINGMTFGPKVTKAWGSYQSSTATTTTPTAFTFSGAVGSLVIPSAFWQAGRSIRVRGVYRFLANTGTSVYGTIRIGGLTGTQDISTGIYNSGQVEMAMFEVICTCVTTGASGGVAITGTALSSVNSLLVTGVMDTTASHTLTISGSVSSTTGTPFLNLYNVSMELMP